MCHDSVTHVALMLSVKLGAFPCHIVLVISVMTLQRKLQCQGLFGEECPARNIGTHQGV